MTILNSQSPESLALNPLPTPRTARSVPYLQHLRAILYVQHTTHTTTTLAVLLGTVAILGIEIILLPRSGRCEFANAMLPYMKYMQLRAI